MQISIILSLSDNWWKIYPALYHALSKKKRSGEKTLDLGPGEYHIKKKNYDWENPYVYPYISFISSPIWRGLLISCPKTLDTLFSWGTSFPPSTHPVLCRPLSPSILSDSDSCLLREIWRWRASRPILFSKFCLISFSSVNNANIAYITKVQTIITYNMRIQNVYNKETKAFMVTPSREVPGGRRMSEL